jgi:hypothetical protein
MREVCEGKLLAIFVGLLIFGENRIHDKQHKPRHDTENEKKLSHSECHDAFDNFYPMNIQRPKLLAIV